MPTWNAEKLALLSVRAFVFLVFVVLPSSTSAAVIAFLESPEAGVVGGVQIVRGWAFATEPGEVITRVDLVVNGEPGLSIPCCGARADVAADYPEYPSAVTLQSGWGLTLNWSLFPPGPHIVQVEIATNHGALWTSEPRTIEVIKLGGFEFIDQLSLADASVRRDGDEIVLEGVRVRDHASGQEQVLTLRLRWDFVSQSLVVSGVATTATVVSFRSTLRGLLAPMWMWLARTTGAGAVQAGSGIQAYWESPTTEQVAAGIGALRAWMFAEEPGVLITNVRLLVDGVVATTLPCCSARGDVAADFPDNPNALYSGAGLVLNYGELPAGHHTLTLEIEASNGATMTFSRTVLVLKPGGFTFLDLFDLTDTSVRIVGEELILEGVRVREKTSQLERTVSLRFHWDLSSQSFVLVANNPPVAYNQGVRTNIGKPVSLLLIAADADGDPVRYEVVEPPSHGVLSGAPPNVIYTPAAGFTGQDRFTFRAHDFVSPSNEAIVTITVESALTSEPPAVDLDPTNSMGQRPNFIATFTEDDGPLLIVNPAMTVSDPDSDALASIRVTLTNLLDAGQEVLAVDPATVAPHTPIVATYDAISGVLSLKGYVAITAYQAALRTLTYDNGSQDPTPTPRIITVIANDGEATSFPVSSTVNIRPVNDQPTFTASDPPTVGENAGPQMIPNWATFDPGAPEEAAQTVLAYTVNAISNPSLFATPPAIATNGTLTYTPANSVTGMSTFMVTVQDDGGRANGGVDTSAPQTFTINVAAVDDPPVAVDDAATVTEDDLATTLDVLANDTDVDGGPISLASVTQPANGTVVITNGGADLTYQPDPDYCNAPPGTTLDTFTYMLTPGGSTATVSMTVTCVNDAPVVDLDGTADDPGGDIDFAATFTEGTPEVIVDEANLTVTDPDSANLTVVTVTLTNLQDVGLETLTATTGGTAITANYVEPTLTLTGPDTVAHFQQVLRTVTYNNTAQNPNTTARVVTFVGNDGTVDSATATSTVTVNAVNSAPSFTKGADQTVLEDAGAQTVNGWATGISDGDGNTQTLTFNVTNNTNASLFSAGPSISATGVLTYTPAANANGSAMVTVTLSDDGGTANGGVDTSAPQTFTITVTAVNDAPSFTVGLDQTVNEDAGAQTVNPWATGISAGPADEAGQMLTFSITNNTNPTLFSAGPNISATGVLTYTPAAETSGSATVTVQLMDDGGTANGGQDVTTHTFDITINAVNDAPSFTKGADQMVAEDAGAQTVNPWATGISAGPANESGQTLTFNVTDNTNPTLFSAGPSISAAGVLTYTPAANANGSATITVVLMDNGGTANGGQDTSAPQNFTITVNPVNDPPTAVDKNYTVQANMQRSIAAGSGLLIGATDVESGTTLTVGTVSATTPAGGTVNVNSSTGAFDFDPPPGVTGDVTFTYEVCDDGIPGPGVCSAPATVTITVDGPVIWFVQQGAAGTNDGRLSNPFTSLGSVPAVDNDGDAVFLFTGTYSDGLTMLMGEQLIGQGVTGVDFDSVFGLMPPAGTIARPAINGTRPTVQDTITVNTDAVVRGLNITTTNTTALTDPIDVVTGVTVEEVAVSATNATAVNFSLFNNTGASGVVTLDSVTSTGGTNNITLMNVGRTVTLGSGALSGASGTAFNAVGGPGTISYSGSITNTAAARLVNIATKSSGSVTLSGNLSGTGSSTGINVQNNATNGTIAFTGSSKVLTTGTNAAVTLDNNDNTTINFSGGGLVITTTSGTGFNAINGATAINVSGAGNTITSTTGTALNVDNSTIGGLGLTFQSISANGATNGIVLNTTGVLGGLTVSGDGGGSNNGSGGTIQNTTGAGVVLDNVGSVSLNYMNITNPGTDGIRVTTLNNGLTVNRSNISDSAGAAPDDKGIDIGDFSTGTPINGTINITNTVIGPAAGNSPHDSLAIGVSSGTSTWNVTNTTFRNTGNSGINMELRGSSVVTAFTVMGSTFAGAGSATSARGIFVNTLDDSVMTLMTIDDNIFTNNNIHIDMNQQNDTDPVGGHTFEILDNTTMTGANSHAINIFAAAGSFGGFFNGRIEGNVIGNSGVAGSGSAIGNGIRVNINGGSDATMLLDDNIIRQTPNGRGIEIIGRNGTGGLDVTVTNNDVNPQDTSGFPLAAILVQSNCLTVCNTVRADVRNNTVPSATDVTDLLNTYLELVESSTSTLELVDTTAPISGTCASELAATNTGSSGVLGGCALIIGPIDTPP